MRPRSCFARHAPIVAALRAQLETAELTPGQLQTVTIERDALKVDVVFFQKQIGALQRAKQPAKPVRPGPAKPDDEPE